MEAWYFEPAKDPKTAGAIDSSSKLWSGCTVLSALMGADQGSKKLWSVKVTDVLDDNVNGVLSHNRAYRIGYDVREPVEAFTRNLVRQNLGCLRPYCRNTTQYRDLEFFIDLKVADTREERILVARHANRVLEQANWAEDWVAKAVAQAVLSLIRSGHDTLSHAQRLVEIAVTAAVARDPFSTNGRLREFKRLNTELSYYFFGE